MDLKEVTPPVTEEKHGTWGWVVAAVAFASIIAVVALAVVLTRSADDGAPATSPTTTLDAAPGTTAPTTTEAPSTSQAPTTQPPSNEAAVAVADALVAAVNAGDSEAVSRIFQAAGSVVSSDTADSDDRAREAGRWSSWALRDTSAAVAGCTALSSGVTRCELTRTSPFDATSEHPQGLVLQIRATPAGVDLLRIDLGAGTWVAVEEAFGLWIRDTQPDAYVPMFVNFSDPQRTAELWRELYPAWLAARP